MRILIADTFEILLTREESGACPLLGTLSPRVDSDVVVVMMTCACVHKKTNVFEKK